MLGATPPTELAIILTSFENHIYEDFSQVLIDAFTNEFSAEEFFLDIFLHKVMQKTEGKTTGHSEFFSHFEASEKCYELYSDVDASNK